ncbi:aldo/keto reductase [Leifsonia sp. NPDC058230]|uniref:aldo/keto reductase n=1 Tax=Leifsonia sp. NPDC058230 TaxID=3346391 RepID=UPI0036DC0679
MSAATEVIEIGTREHKPGPVAIGYGAAALGAPAMTDDQANDLVDRAWECGIRYFDTAPHYGLGVSERRLGRALRARPRDELILSTKVGRLLMPDAGGELQRVWDYSPEGIRRSITDSLTRLELERIDIAYLHDPDFYEGADDGVNALETAIDALVELRDEGLIEAIGVGSTDVDVLAGAVRTGVLDLVMLAGRFTLLEQSSLRELLPLCLVHGVGVVNVGVFNTGILAETTPTDSARYAYRPASPDVVSRARRLAIVCAEFGVDLPTAAIHYAKRHPAVRAVVVGADDDAQIAQNVERWHTSVPDGLWTRLAELELIANV